jgi:hypothetical protein
MESPDGRRRRRRRSAGTGTCTAVPGLLVGLTKLCKLTKVCAAPTPGDEAAAESRVGNGTYGGYDQRLLLTRLFEAVASLKSAYIKLQRAHFPYDPARFAFADEIITSELDSVAALHLLLCSSSSGSGVGSLVNERWSVVQQLEAETRERDSEIMLLQRELQALQRGNSKLSKQIKSAAAAAPAAGKPSSAKHDPPDKVLATPSALLEMFRVASASVHEFAGLIASSSSTPSVPSDEAGEQSWRRRYALEAHLSRTMLGSANEGEEAWLLETGGAARFDRIMRFCDPMEALMLYPSSSFSRFCRSRYPAAVPRGTEAAVCGNLDQRAFVVSRGGHPRTCFYRAFATMARSAWALRVAMAARCAVERGAHGVVRMFYARGGSEFDGEWMESVAAAAAAAPASGGGGGGEGDVLEEKVAVAFTVTPGVKVGDTVVKCRVLLCRHQEERFIQVQ